MLPAVPLAHPERPFAFMRLRRLGFLCAVSALVLAGCNSNANQLTSTTGLAAVRILNGSPDLGSVDVYLNTATGTPLAPALTYGTLNIYTNEAAAKKLTVVVTAAGVPSSTKLSCALPGLTLNTRYTVVIAGTVAGGATATGLQCQLFAETVYSLPANQFQLSFHYASATLGATQPTVSFGLYSAGANNYQLPTGNATFTATTAGGTSLATAVNTLVPAVQTAPGLGVYVSAETGTPPTSVLATTTPSQATLGLSGATGAQNSNNFMPYTTTTGAVTTTVSSILSVYAIDASGGNGVALVCAMD